MALHLPIRTLKTSSGLEPVSRSIPVPTSPLADDITTAPSGSGPIYVKLFNLEFDSDIILDV